MDKLRKGHIKTINRLCCNKKTGSVTDIYKRYQVIIQEDGNIISKSKILSSKIKAETYLNATKRRWKRMGIKFT